MKFGRNLLKTGMALLVAGASAPAWSAGDYPAKPITIVVPFTAGGTTDSMGRSIGKALAADLGAAVVVVNRPGGGSTIGVNSVAKAEPDGYTFLVTTVSLAINAGLRSDLPYDTLKDLVPVSQVASLPLVLAVGPTVQARSLGELVAQAKREPGKLNYASGGVGTSPHLAGEMLKVMAGIDMVHVPYKGNAPIITDMIGGHVDMTFGLVPSVLPSIQAGKMRPLAVTTQQRLDSLPDIPTIAESGYPGYEVSSWQGVFAPAGTPAEILDKVSRSVARMVAEPVFKASMATEGAAPVGSSPAEFGAYFGKEVAKWTRLVQEAEVKAQ